MLEELEKEGCIKKVTTKRAREVMELGRDEPEVKSVPERKDSDFVWIVTEKGKSARPEDFEPNAREENQTGEDIHEDHDMVKHPISRNARRRKLRELRSHSRRRPIGEQLEKLKTALYGDWMSHDYDPKKASSSSNASGTTRQTTGMERRERPSSRPILRGQIYNRTSRSNDDSSLLERAERRKRESSSRRPPASQFGQSTWIARRALLTARLPRDLFR